MIVKKWYESKTLFVNIFLFIAAVLMHFGFVGELPAELEVFVLPVVAVVNVILRLITKAGLVK